ncbi:MAG: hypothetical protein ACE5FA_12165 [Dehalococcoidia bacterium]
MSQETTDDRTVRERLDAIEQAVKSRPEAPVDPKEPADFAGDKVGVGRYILSFFLASFIGLWVAYWARYYGWRAIWINLAIFVASVIFLVATADFSTAGQTCYFDQFGNYRCN